MSSNNKKTNCEPRNEFDVERSKNPKFPNQLNVKHNV